MARTIRLVLVASIAAVLALSAGCGAGAPAQQAPVRVTLTLGSADIAPAYANYTSIPQAGGLWKEEGLEVTVVGTQSGNASVQALVSGQSQVATSASSSLFQSREQGATIKAVYNNLTKNIFYPVVLEDSSYRSPADLKGKTIGVSSLGSGYIPIIKSLLTEAKLDPEKDVQWVAVGSGSKGIVALKDKSIDALALWDEPYARMALEGVKLRAFRSAAIDKLTIGAPFMVTEDFLKSNRATVVKVLRGIAKSSVFALANPEAAIQLHWKAYPSAKPLGKGDAEALKEEVSVYRARLDNMRVDHRSDKKWGYMPPDEIGAYVDFLVNTKVIKAKGDVNSYYTNDLIDEVNKFDADAVARKAKEFKP